MGVLSGRHIPIPSCTSSPSRRRQAQARVTLVVPGPHTQMVAEIEQVMLGNGGFWDLNQGRLLLLSAAWMEAGPLSDTPRLPRATGHLSLH